MDLQVSHQIARDDVILGIAVAEGLDIQARTSELDNRLAELLLQRQAELSPEEDHIRKTVRLMLRYGKYKPSGRSKPASEYLIRSAVQQQFPRINCGVDTINYLSLKYLVPISLWDIDLAATNTYSFRFGREGENYIFNSADQTIDLQDLMVGCAVVDGTEIPIVNPVKDSLRTKTTDSSKNVAMVIYCPEIFAENTLPQMFQEFCDILQPVVGSTITHQVFKKS